MPLFPTRRLVAAAALLGSALCASAQVKEVKVGQVGLFALHKIDEKGQFNRCALTLEPGANMFRLAWTKDHVYSLSVPGVTSSNGKPIVMNLSLGRLGTFPIKATTNGLRTWGAVNTNVIEKMLEARGVIKVDSGDYHFQWNVGNAPMGDAIGKLEDCVWKAHGR